MTALDRILDALAERGLRTRASGGAHQAQCPAHEDRNPSLSLRHAGDSVLIHCHGGCDTDDVLAELGMTRRDLYDEPRGNELARYTYTDAAGQPTRTVHRLDGKQFRQSGDKTRVQLYRLPKVVAAARAEQPVYLVEGEKDVHAVESCGAVATTAPQGAANFDKVDVSPLRGADVIAVVDRDAAGQKWAAAVHGRLDGYARSLRLVEATTGKDAADHIAAGRTLEELRTFDIPTPGWDAPLPLGWHVDLPAFPVDALPPVLARFVRGQSEELQTPTDLLGTVVLGMVAAAVGGRVLVVVRRGWTEPTNLFLVPVMPPGSRKSAVVAVCRRPITEAEAELVEKLGPGIRDLRTERQIRDQHAEALMRAAAKEGDPVAIMEAQEAVRRADGVVVPPWPRLTTSDATPEALITLLALHGGRIAAISAEAGIFGSLTGRYSKTPNLDPVLMAHAGDDILVDRKSREPERVDRPALTLVASIQPFALREMVSRPDFGGRGLLARIMWSLPVDNTGHREVEPPEMPEADREAYQVLVRDLALSMAQRTDSVHLQLTESARKVHTEYYRQVEARLRRGREMGADLVREWGSKLAGAVARIAGILHCAGDSVSQPISETTMRAAVTLGDYFQAHAIAALDSGGESGATGNARNLLAYLIEKELRRFKVRDLRSGPKATRKAADLKPVVDELVSLGWLREHTDGGWELHPHAARLLNPGDRGDKGDTAEVLAGQPVAESVAPVVAQRGDTGDSVPPRQSGVAPVAQRGDRWGDKGASALSRENGIPVAPVAPVAPIRLAEFDEDLCPFCGEPTTRGEDCLRCFPQAPEGATP